MSSQGCFYKMEAFHMIDLEFYTSSFIIRGK